MIQLDTSDSVSLVLVELQRPMATSSSVARAPVQLAEPSACYNVAPPPALLISTYSLEEKLVELADGVLRVSDRVPADVRVFVDLVVITALEGLVTEEMDFPPAVRQALASLVNVVQSVSLVPAGGKHIETDLSTNAVRETEVRKLLLERLDEGLTDLVLLVKCLEVMALLHTGK